MPNTRRKYLGIDYGEKRVGIALSDDDAKFAMPRAVLPNDRTLFSEVKNMCDAHKVKAIVIGESKDYKGNENPIMKHIKFFKGELERELHLPVHFEPEFMTSQEAARTQGPNSPLLDASAAAIILQSYLDRKNTL